MSFTALRRSTRALAPLLSRTQHRVTTTRTLTPALLSRSYHQNVIDHYENPRNVGSLDKNSPDVGTGLVGAPACGDVMKLQIRTDGNGKIVETKFKTFGCGSAIASSSLASTWLEGKSLDEAVKIKNSDIARHLNLPPVKLHCSMLAEDAIKAAVSDLNKKRAAKGQAPLDTSAVQSIVEEKQSASASA